MEEIVPPILLASTAFFDILCMTIRKPHFLVTYSDGNSRCPFVPYPNLLYCTCLRQTEHCLNSVNCPTDKPFTSTVLFLWTHKHVTESPTFQFAFCCSDQTLIKSIWGKERVSLILLVHHQGKYGRKPSRRCSRIHGVMVLTSLCLPVLLHNPGPPVQRRHHPQ